MERLLFVVQQHWLSGIRESHGGLLLQRIKVQSLTADEACGSKLFNVFLMGQYEEPMLSGEDNVQYAPTMVAKASHGLLNDGRIHSR